jgi:hypothetical protein
LSCRNKYSPLSSNLFVKDPSTAFKSLAIKVDEPMQTPPGGR